MRPTISILETTTALTRRGRSSWNKKKNIRRRRKRKPSSQISLNKSLRPKKGRISKQSKNKLWKRKEQKRRFRKRKKVHRMKIWTPKRRKGRPRFKRLTLKISR